MGDARTREGRPGGLQTVVSYDSVTLWLREDEKLRIVSAQGFENDAERLGLDRQVEAVRQSVARKALDLGLRHYSRTELEALRASLLHLLTELRDE